MVAAISLETLAAVIFHVSQKHIVTIVKYWLYQKKKDERMFVFVEAEIERRKRNQSQSGLKKNSEIKEFFMLLEKAIQIIDKKI
jgi:hypothetical protein